MGDMNTGPELLADEIAQKIKEKIQNQQFKQGQRLPVRALCDEFGTSETPVKQALNQLVTTGLVVATPKCGMRVRNFTFQDMKDNWEARLMIEQFCAPAAVDMTRYNEAFVKRLEELLRLSNERYETCINHYTKENFSMLSEYDRQLHTELVKCCHNEQILNMYYSLNAHAGMFVGYNCHSPETLRGVQKQHTEIVRQLLLCDVDGLKKALEQHIYSTVQIYRSTGEYSDGAVNFENHGKLD